MTRHSLVLASKTLTLLVFVLVFALSQTFVLAETNEFAKLTLYKYIQDADVNNDHSANPDDDQPIIDSHKKLAKGVAYRLLQTDAFIGVVEEGKPIVGRFAPLNKPIETILVTDENGKAEVSTLALGRYTLQEFTAEDYKSPEYATALESNNPDRTIPAGLTPNTQVFTLEFPYVTEQNPNKARLELTIYPKNQWVSGQIGIQKWAVQGGDDENKQAHKDVVYKLYTKKIMSDGSTTLEEVTQSPLTGEPIGEIKTDEQGIATITNLKANETYYLLEVDTNNDGYTPRDLQLREVVAKPSTETLVREAFFNDKPLKQVKFGASEYASQSVAQVEKDIDYKITVKTPSTPSALTSFVVEDAFQDTVQNFVAFIPDSSITGIKDFSVMVDGQEALDDFSFEAIRNGTDIVGFKLSAKNPVTLPAEKLLVVMAKAKVKSSVITQTTLTEFPNDVKQTVTYNDPVDPSNNPIVSSGTDTGTVVIPRGGLWIQKFDLEKNNGIYDENTNFLNGAVFKVYLKSDYDNSKDTATVQATLTTSNNGSATLDNLPVDTYVLVETEFPTVSSDDPKYAGRKYVSVKDQIEVVVRPYKGENNVNNPYGEVGEEDSLPSISLLDPQRVDGSVNYYTLSSIPNSKPRWFLPFTGGNGIRMFTIVGTLLIVLSASLAVIGKRYTSSKDDKK